jgi:hypothetical protein
MSIQEFGYWLQGEASSTSADVPWLAEYVDLIATNQHLDSHRRANLHAFSLVSRLIIFGDNLIRRYVHSCFVL